MRAKKLKMVLDDNDLCIFLKSMLILDIKLNVHDFVFGMSRGCSQLFIS